jgi:hypothetical protein
MVDNLGIYNNTYHMYDTNDNYDINKHMEHGVEFLKFKKISSNNQHTLLQTSTSSNYGSIIEALEGDDSGTPTTMHEMYPMSQEEEIFKVLSSDYSTLYKTYLSTMLTKDMRDLERIRMENELNEKKIRLLEIADKLINNMNSSSSSFGASSSVTNRVDNQAKIINYINELNNTTINNKYKYDDITVKGKLETTQLNMTSMYYHYIVYFIICVTLISFTFNIFVNENADVMNAMIVVGGLLVIFLISRKV